MRVYCFCYDTKDGRDFFEISEVDIPEGVSPLDVAEKIHPDCYYECSYFTDFPR